MVQNGAEPFLNDKPGLNFCGQVLTGEVLPPVTTFTHNQAQITA